MQIRVVHSVQIQVEHGIDARLHKLSGLGVVYVVRIELLVSPVKISRF